MELRLTAGPAVLRHWRDEDAEPLALVANDRRIACNLRDAFPHPYGIEDARRFLKLAAAMAPRTYFAIELSGRVAGGIGYTLHGDVERIAAEVGYWLSPEFWNRGVMTAAVRSLSGHAFRSHPELRRLYALPYASNPASGRVLVKAGYRLEATLRQSAIKEGVVRDQWVYALLRHEFEALAAP